MPHGPSSISQKALEKLQNENPFLSNTELAYRLVRDDIVEHRLPPGSKLNQEEIAATLDMSRSPVREALYRLEQEGYLSKGAQGYTVYTMKIGDYMALLDLRIAIETLATRLCCSRIRISEMKKIEKNLLDTKKLLEEGIETAWNEDFEITNRKKAEILLYELGKKDREFHELIIRASHNRYVVEAYNEMLPRIHFFRYSALDVNACLNMLERHKAVYSAITSRDEELSAQRMATHLQLTVTRAMRY